MPTYRKLSQDEVLSLANRIKFEDRLDLDSLREGIKELFGETAHKAVFQFDNEYNDEGYDLRATSVKVTDAKGKTLKRPKTEDDYDEALYDFFYDNEISDVGMNEELGEVTVIIDEPVELYLPDLYVKE